MNLGPQISQFLERLSHKIEANEEDGILTRLPNQHTQDDKSLLEFLSCPYLIFQNSFCCRPAGAELFTAHTHGDYLMIVRKIKKSDMVIIIWLQHTALKRSEDSHQIETYKIIICGVNPIQSIGGISNCNNWSPNDCRLLANCRYFFKVKYSKNNLSWFLKKIRIFCRKIFKTDKEQKIRDEIWTELQKLEKEAQKFIDGKIITMR